MQPLIYSEFVAWYPLFDPLAGHQEEALCYREAFLRNIEGKKESLLELGSGAGNNAYYLKSVFHCTLSDISPEILELSKTTNPESTHLVADMRSLKLSKQFDAVLVHDAISYMSRLSDLKAALHSAYIHTRPGGIAIVTPDSYRETFVEQHYVYLGQDEKRSLKALEWSWDPQPSDDSYQADYVFMLRESGRLRTVHDQHTVGLFSQETWLTLLTDLGFQVSWLPRPIGEGEFDQVLLCRKPL